ncbi:hypothetical protein ACRALDRAFT_1082451 [Sodiomyces alcalophilus JCM 7366]|uniref:uncharacterized protein n=1 Tax=Sodiomyces alcalophilus JCM 7366 TaxID=591952 RepID=UPI0039B5577F
MNKEQANYVVPALTEGALKHELRQVVAQGTVAVGVRGAGPGVQSGVWGVQDQDEGPIPRSKRPARWTPLATLVLRPYRCLISDPRTMESPGLGVQIAFLVAQGAAALATEDFRQHNAE